MGQETKFTPGAWYVNGGELIGDSTILATLCWHSGRDIENEADANLIAAAPDLYAALAAMIADAERCGIGDLADQMDADVVAKARAALARARGEQP